MPEWINCKVCGHRLKVGNFADRMAKIRRHYKEHHPILFKRAIQRGVEKRKRNRS